ncbi:MAG: hypothetical protein WCT04_02005 [Planctomycetota bacterium]
MTKQAICNAYQTIIRTAYPRAIVLPCSNEWNPYREESYQVFFIPDGAGADYMNRWIDDCGWFDLVEKQGLPKIILMDVCESDTRKHYTHLFPEVFGGKSTGSAKSKKSKPALKSRATRNVPVAVKQ